MGLVVMSTRLSSTLAGARELPSRRCRQGGALWGGFTIVEVLIASVLLLMIAIGVLPLFTQSMVSNVQGFDHTQVASFARARGEEFKQLPFDSPDLALVAGTERTFDEYYSQTNERWMDGTVPVGDTALWTRTTTIRQFNVADLSVPLADTALAENVHLKEITVAVQNPRVGPLGVGKEITVRLFKAQ